MRRETVAHYPSALYRHGGVASAISHARRRNPVIWEIAGQARNND